MPEGRVMYAQCDGIHVLRFVGDVRYPIAPSVKTFLDDLVRNGLSEEMGSGMIVDLTETRSIDSTNLGLLARLATQLDLAHAPRATVVVRRDDIHAVLASMGFEDVFDVSRLPPAAVNGENSMAVDAVEPRDQLGQTMLEAHRCLMALNENNAGKFRDVVKLLESETK